MNITIPDDAWEENGDEPGSHLLTQIEINGCGMHLEALPVLEEADPEIGGTQHIDGPEWVRSALFESADYEVVQTVTIRGRKYALIATPHQV